MMLLVSAGNMITVYLGLELLTLSQYALVALNRDSRASSEAAMKYFVLGALASGLLLYGMSMIYGATGTLDLAKIHVVVARHGESPHARCSRSALVFMIAGIAFKFGAAPFHMWMPDVYEGAPTAMVVFVGSAPKLAAFGMAYRLLEGGLGGMRAHWTHDAERARGALARDRQRLRDRADQSEAPARRIRRSRTSASCCSVSSTARRAVMRRRCSTRSATR